MMPRSHTYPAPIPHGKMAGDYVSHRVKKRNCDREGYTIETLRFFRVFLFGEL
jgi:hypothetical protein